MAKKQHRRNVSLRPGLYIRLKHAGGIMGVPFSRLADEAITRYLDDMAAPPEPPKDLARRLVKAQQKQLPPKDGRYRGQHFTF